MLTPKRFEIATARPVSDCLFMQTSSIGGSRESDVTALAVVPYFRPSWSAGTTVTPLAKWVITSRNSSDVRLRGPITSWIAAAAPAASGAQPLRDPAVTVAAEADAVMQAAGAALPELDLIRLQGVASPERRPRHVLPLEALLVL